MSWHTTALFINADYSKDPVGLLSKLGFDGAVETGDIDFDDASSSSNDGIAIGFTDGWTLLWGGMSMLMVDYKAVAEIALKADVFQMILEGASDTAGFTWYTGGKLVRDWMIQSGDVFKDEGPALPQEKKAKTKRDSEQAILALAEMLTLPYEKWESAEYTLYDLDEN